MRKHTELPCAFWHRAAITTWEPNARKSIRSVPHGKCDRDYQCGQGENGLEYGCEVGKESINYGRTGSKSMVREIVRDVFFLAQKSEPATKEDLQVGRDLMDTLKANRERCVGMAANMIGVRKNIIIVNMGFVDMVMFNPVILKKDTPYETEEGCLSLEGVRPTTRYQNIEVEYLDFAWKKQKMKLTGWPAQICQHEMDHLEGRII